MVSRPPEHCPSCGAAVEAVDPPTVHHCEACEEYVFHNPSPNCRAVVVDCGGSESPRRTGDASDDDSVLLVEIADRARVSDPPYPDHREWMLPGGHLEVGEQPAEAAARELEEEAGLVADPDALCPLDAHVRQVVAGVHSLILPYAVRREATSGRLRAGDDAADCRFWSPADLAAADDAFRSLHEEPAWCRDPARWVERARVVTEPPG